jgi:hypothetical protein
MEALVDNNGQIDYVSHETDIPLNLNQRAEVRMQMQVNEVQQNMSSSDAWYIMFQNTDRQSY